MGNLVILVDLLDESFVKPKWWREQYMKLFLYLCVSMYQNLRSPNVINIFFAQFLEYFSLYPTALNSRREKKKEKRIFYNPVMHIYICIFIAQLSPRIIIDRYGFIIFVLRRRIFFSAVYQRGKVSQARF